MTGGLPDVDIPEVSYSVSWESSITEVPKNSWDALTESLSTPLLDWEWLRQMEESGSIRPQTGWLPVHLTLKSGSDLLAAAPLYVKGHSEGEFVWDYMWADVATRLKTKYYPKLIGMSPATPAVGYRFLIAPGEDEEQLTGVMLAAIDQFCEANELSGCSFHFADPEWRSLVEKFGYTPWLHQSYEWQNRGFTSFDDYLSSFTKNQRRNIRRERRAMEEQGLQVRALTGDAISDRNLDLMYNYYEDTNAQFGPWAAKYLNREFFKGLWANYRHRLLIIAAYDSDTGEDPVGMSFLITKADTLIGRYWGATARYNALHFNACYYSPIEWAIEHGIKRFDPGAGSPHKLRRGFEAVGNYSLHRFRDPTLRRVMENHIEEINGMEEQRIAEMNNHVPFKEEHRQNGELKLTY